MKNIRSFTKDELRAELAALDMKPFRAGQIFDWLHVKGATGFDEMTNLSLVDREKLAGEFDASPLSIRDVQISSIDGTRKYLFLLHDGNMIESVLMSYKHGYSVCISTQAGCRMGCRFCASTLNGLARNLTAGEMLSQIYGIERHAGVKISNIVTMGSGEPLDNYDELVKFIRLVSDPDGRNISQRNITVSTCGLVENMMRFADEGFAVTLAVSLHAPNDDIRRQTMPIANAYSIDSVIDACRYFFEKTGRRVSFEYSLIKGVNDSRQNALELAGRLKGLNCHVNLIPVNPVKERSYERSQRSDIESFAKMLEKKGINATIRREMGRDIDGACGQLRKRYLDSDTQ